ncbi:MAG: DUF4157 domain-containing protein [Chloroflexi bacterium]|nr:DUF4157 domain-containing protein [Chloroflexota bacterium]
MTQERKAAPENQTQRRIHKPEQTKGQAIETAVVSPISLLQRRQPLSPTAARALQRTIGNQALRRLTIQRKMSVGPVGDKYEQEADAVAKQVVSQLHNSKTHQTSQAATAQRQEDEELQMEPLVQRQEEEELQMKPFLQRQEDEEELQMKPLLQRQEEEEELQMKPLAQRQEEEELQAKRDPMLAGGELQGDVETAVAQAKSGGQSLNDAIRQPMEQAFNADFSRVKIHNGSTADHLNRSLSARAFTTGQDIFFRSGEYNPGSAAGQELIAHELTHTIQQGAAPRNNRLQPARQAATHKMAASQALLQRALMSANEFKEATGGKLLETSP